MTNEQLRSISTDCAKFALRAYFQNDKLFAKKFGHTLTQKAAVDMVHQHMIDLLHINSVQIDASLPAAIPVPSPVVTPSVVPAEIAAAVDATLTAANPVPSEPIDAPIPAEIAVDFDATLTAATG